MNTVEYIAFRESPDVATKFALNNRNNEACAVADLMAYRQKRRQDPEMPECHTNNLLTIVSGSHGIGKSIFLRTFPTSEAYKKFSNNTTPIVSIFTTKYGVDNPFLIIVYWAAVTMGLLHEDEYTWDMFFNRFHGIFVSGFHSEPLQLLRRVFGDNRRVLLLLDDAPTPKWGDDQEPGNYHFYRALDYMMDCEGDCDLIVVANPPFHWLGSRRTNWVALKPLLREKLGEKECSEWADGIIQELGTDNIDQSKQNLLRNVYMLYSGLPRALEQMVTAMQDPLYDWKDLRNALLANGTSVMKILCLLSTILPQYITGNAWSQKDTESYVFRHYDTKYRGSSGDGEHLISNNLMIS